MGLELRLNGIYQDFTSHPSYYAAVDISFGSKRTGTKRVNARGQRS